MKSFFLIASFIFQLVIVNGHLHPIWISIGNIDGDVHALIENKETGMLWIGGNFSSAGGSNIPNIALYNGSSFNSVGDGLQGIVKAFTFGSGNTLFIGGQFIKSGSRNVVQYDTLTNQFSALASGVGSATEIVQALAYSSSNILFAGGLFTTPSSNVAMWSGSTWMSLGSGTNSQVFALLFWSSQLYIGGSFTQAGNVTASRIATWDGSNFQALRSGLNGDVRCLTVYSLLDVATEYVLMGGAFTTADGVPTYNIVGWNGTAYVGYTTLNPQLGTINALKVDSYTGATYAGGNQGNLFGYGDASVWDPEEQEIFGGSVNAFTNNPSTSYNETIVYIAGSFDSAASLANTRSIVKILSHAGPREEGEAENTNQSTNNQMSSSHEHFKGGYIALIIALIVTCGLLILIAVCLRTRFARLLGASGHGHGHSHLKENMMIAPAGSINALLTSHLSSSEGNELDVFFEDQAAHPKPVAIPISSFFATVITGDGERYKIKFEPAPADERPMGEKFGECSHFVAKAPFMDMNDTISVSTSIQLNGVKREIQWNPFDVLRYCHHQD